jgi:hypothetical protein
MVAGQERKKSHVVVKCRGAGEWAGSRNRKKVATELATDFFE